MMMKKKPHPIQIKQKITTRQKRIVMIFAIVGSIIILFPIFLIMFGYLQLKLTTLKDIEQRYEINVPHTATNTHFDYSVVRDTSVRIRFDLPNEDFVAFETMIDAVCTENADDYFRSPIIYKETDDWWIGEADSRSADRICFGNSGTIYAYFRKIIDDTSVIFLYIT